MAITIHDVADKANVSKSTVSRVFNGGEGVANSVIDRVQRVAKEMGYVSKSNGERGRPRKSEQPHMTTTFAVLIPDDDINATNTPLSSHLLHGVVNWGLSKNTNAILTHLSPGKILPTCITRKEVSGIIARTGDNLPKLQKQMSDLPLVVAFEAEYYMTQLDADFVQPDNRMVAELVLQEFQRLGCETIIALEVQRKGPLKERMREFQSVSKALEKSIELSNLESEQLFIFAQRVKEATCPVGIFLPTGDGLFFQVLRALEKNGLEVGRDVHIIPCCNDPETVWAIEPSITCIDICAEQVGVKAAEILMHRLNHRNAHHQRVLVRPMLRKKSPTKD